MNFRDANLFAGQIQLSPVDSPPQSPHFRFVRKWGEGVKGKPALRVWGYCSQIQPAVGFRIRRSLLYEPTQVGFVNFRDANLFAGQIQPAVGFRTGRSLLYEPTQVGFVNFRDANLFAGQPQPLLPCEFPRREFFRRSNTRLREFPRREFFRRSNTTCRWVSHRAFTAL